MNHDHDDGLVHAHGWAKEPPPSVGELLRATEQPVPSGAQIAAAMNSKQDAPPAGG